MNYDIEPIEDFNALLHSGVIASALGKMSAADLAEKRVLAHPLKIILGGSVFEFSSEVLEVATGVVTTVNLSHTITTETTVDEILNNIVTAYNTSTVLFAEANIAYKTDELKYLTVVTREGYVFQGAPTLVGFNIDTTEQVQASVGSPAAFMAYQSNLLQDYPQLTVEHIYTQSVCENWSKDVVIKKEDTGDVEYPYYESYIRAFYQVKVNSGAVEEVIREGRKDSTGILRKIFTKLQDSYEHVRFSNSVSGTLNRDFNPNNIKPSIITNFEDATVVTISLDIISRYVNYEGGIITRVEVDNAELVRREGTPEYISFHSESPSHI